MSKLFAIADLHLPGGTGKTMDQFGPNWVEHSKKIGKNWQKVVGPQDLVLIPGDISWAMKLTDAQEDLELIGSWPGTKIMVKGNHDYWWQGIGKLRKILPSGVHALQNDSLNFHDWHFAGTRGWQAPGTEKFTPEDEKIYIRELGRLRLSLETMEARRKNGKTVVMLHYPPFNEKGEPTEFVAMMKEFDVDICVYGHLHGERGQTGVEGMVDGIIYHLVACDQIDFTPLFIGQMK